MNNKIVFGWQTIVELFSYIIFMVHFELNIMTVGAGCTRQVTVIIKTKLVENIFDIWTCFNKFSMGIHLVLKNRSVHQTNNMPLHQMKVIFQLQMNFQVPASSWMLRIWREKRRSCTNKITEYIPIYHMYIIYGQFTIKNKTHMPTLNWVVINIIIFYDLLFTQNTEYIFKNSNF